MNHKEKLLQVYKQATNAEDIQSENLTLRTQILN